MNICEYNLGSILKTAEDISPTDPRPSLDFLQAKIGLTTEEMVAALEFIPNPLGWRLDNELSSSRQCQFVVNGKSYTRLMINRFTTAGRASVYGQ